MSMTVVGAATVAGVMMVVQGHTRKGKLFEVIAIDDAQSRDTDREVSKVHFVRRRRTAPPSLRSSVFPCPRDQHATLLRSTRCSLEINPLLSPINPLITLSSPISPSPTCVTLISPTCITLISPSYIGLGQFVPLSDECAGMRVTSMYWPDQSPSAGWAVSMGSGV